MGNNCAWDPLEAHPDPKNQIKDEPSKRAYEKKQNRLTKSGKKSYEDALNKIRQGQAKTIKHHKIKDILTGKKRLENSAQKQMKGSPLKMDL